MFDFAWSEIALIGIVALVAIGPKDLPVAIKAVSQMVKKARKMAGEFQTHVDEMVREADLGEARNAFNDLRRMDIKGQILRAVDSDGTIRKTLNEPVDFSPPPPPIPVHDSVPPPSPPAEVAFDSPALPEAEALPTVAVAPRPEPVAAPAFVPPRYAPAGERAAKVPPAFVPPAYCPPVPIPPAAA